MNLDSLYFDLVSRVRAGTFRLRESSNVLYGPSLAVGSCLSPLIEDGDRLWIDRDDTDAKTGDLVLLKFTDEAMHNMVEGVKAGAAEGNPVDQAWLEEYGEDLSPYSVKLYVDGHAAISPFEAAKGETAAVLPMRHFEGGVLGIVRKVERDGVPLYVERVSCIRPRFIDGTTIDAGVPVLYATESGSVTTTLLAQAILTIAVPAHPVAHRAQVIATCDAWKSSGPTDVQRVYLGRGPGSSPQGTIGQPSYITSTADPGTRHALQFTFDGAANTAMNYYLWYLGENLGNVSEIRNATLQVLLLKAG